VKSRQILLFIILIILVLAGIAFAFPKQGIQLGFLHLQFPTVENIMNDPNFESEIDFASMEEKDIYDTNIDSLYFQEDTIARLTQVIATNPARILCPNDDYTYFASVFAEMEQAQSFGKVVRILHYGDSQIELDRISSNLRTALQAHFGGEGPGLIPLYQSVPSSSVIQSASGDYETFAIYGDLKRLKSKEYGVMARFSQVRGNCHLNLSAPQYKKIDSTLCRYSQISLLLNNKSTNLNVVVEDRKTKQKYTKIDSVSGLSLLQFPLDIACSKLSIHITGNADVYGIFLDAKSGVSVDNIPIRGSAGTFFTDIEDSTLAWMYEKLNVSLIILQFGGNVMPSLYNNESIRKYCISIEKQLHYFHRIYPKAKLLFIGPSDMSTCKNGILQTYPQLPMLIDSLKATCLNNGVAYWDIYANMGGYNSMIQWVKKGWAGNDYIHFTPTGAKAIGERLAESFLQLYGLKEE